MTVSVTAAQLRKIVGGKAPFADQTAAAINKYGYLASLTSPLRVCHFLAQIGTESKLLYVTEIWGPTAAQKRYEGREDLGNIHAGDGRRFMGRSLIQVTGRANYRECTVWIRKLVPDAPDFEAQPDMLAKFPWAFLAATWFWATRGLNKLADADDIVGATKRVNGGTNGLADRQATLKRAKAALIPVQRPVALAAPSEAEDNEPAIPTARVKAGRWPEGVLSEFEIRGVQQRLRDLGYLDSKVDGIWGQQTVGAISKLQHKAGIATDGHYGPATRAALADPGNAFQPSLQRLEMTEDDLRQQGSETIARADDVEAAAAKIQKDASQTGAAAGAGAAGLGSYGLFQALSAWGGQTFDWLKQIRDNFPEIGAVALVCIGVGILVFLFVKSRKTKARASTTAASAVAIRAKRLADEHSAINLNASSPASEIT